MVEMDGGCRGGDVDGWWGVEMGGGGCRGGRRISGCRSGGWW